MAAQASLSLSANTYVAAGVSDRLAGWIFRSDGTPSGFSNASISLPTPGASASVYRVTAKLSVPIVQAEDTACSCTGTLLRTGNCTVEFLLPTTSTTAERTDLYERFKDLIEDAQFVAAVENLVLPTS